MAYHYMYSLKTDKFVHLFTSMDKIKDFIDDLVISGLLDEYDQILIERVSVFYD